jgi:hypothetical protein
MLPTRLYGRRARAERRAPDALLAPTQAACPPEGPAAVERHDFSQSWFLIQSDR